MLNLLIDYARTHGITIEPGFKPKTVRWAIVCDREGRFLNVQELGHTEEKNNRGQIFAVCPDLSLSEMKGAGSGCRHFLVDNVEVVALLGKDGDLSGDKKSKAKHDFFVSLLRQSSKIMSELSGIATLLDSSESLATIQRAFSEQRFKPTDSATFAVYGRNPMYLVEDGAWHEWWRGFRQSLLEAKTAKNNKPRQRKKEKEEVGSVKSMRCLASGSWVQPALVHPKIEGLSNVGGLPMGDNLASFKQESFCSYFLGQAENAAVSEDMAAAYRGGLNELIARHSRRLSNAKVVHWYAGSDKVPDALDPFSWLAEIDDAETTELAAQAKAGKLLDAIRTSHREDLMDYRFYCLTISGASGRVMIRDWIEGRFADLAANIEAWFDHLSIVRRDGDRLAPPPKFRAVLGGFVRELSDVPPPAEAKMWRVAVRQEPIPEWAMVQALARVKVDIIQDNPFNHARMGLLKAYHAENRAAVVQDHLHARMGLLKAYHARKGDKAMQPYLNEKHPNPAYQCGRLLAIYADLQRAALGDIGAGIIQRYYAAASATPALILGRLARGSQFHLNKLDGGLAYWFEQRLAAIWGRIEEAPPKVLTLEEQSLFALGYYQQLAARKTKQVDEAKANESIESDDNNKTKGA